MKRNKADHLVKTDLSEFFPLKSWRKNLLRLFLLLFFCGLNFTIPNEAYAKTENSFRPISSEEFLSGSFASAFKERQYSKALKALEDLKNQYPNDPLILRYEALTLDRLGRTQEAINAYQKLLSQYPDQAPARIFLGRAYIRKGNYQAAAEEFRHVIQDNTAEEYRGWAQAELNRIHRGAVKQKPPKRFYLVSKGGISYDSNPLLMPKDSNLRSGKVKKGAGYLMDVTAGYVPFLQHDSRIDLLYIGKEALHDPRTSRVNFHSHGFAIDGKKRHFFGRHSVLFNGRYDFRSNFLKSELFSISNRFYFSADTSFIKRTRTHLYGRFNILNFGRDGSIPSQTSRDGLRTGFGVTQYFYSQDLKRFLFLKEEFNFNETRGYNFDRRGFLSRVGIHTPVDFLKKTDFDTAVGFNLGAYPDFNSLSTLNLTKRQDEVWDIYAGITHHWKPWFATRIFYRFIESKNENNFFERDRHLVGGEVIFGI